MAGLALDARREAARGKNAPPRDPVSDRSKETVTRVVDSYDRGTTTSPRQFPRLAEESAYWRRAVMDYGPHFAIQRRPPAVPVGAKAPTVDAVERYLDNHPWMRDLVHDAESEIRRVFGPGTCVRFEVIRDDEGHEQLFAYVTSASDRDGAYAALARLDDEWLIDADTRGCFNVDLDGWTG